MDSVPIKAVPEDSYYTVTIDGSDVDDSDNYKKTVYLDKGENDIKVEIQDDSNDDRVYTLKITRAVVLQLQLVQAMYNNCNFNTKYCNYCINPVQLLNLINGYK